MSPWSIQDLEADCFGGKPASSTGGGGRADTERPYSAYMLFYERRDAPACDQSVAEMRSIPRDVVIAAAATPTAPLTPAETPTVAAATTTAVFGRGSDWLAAGGAGERPSEQTSAGADVVFGEGDAMETDGISSSQEQQRYGGVGCTRLAEPAVVTTPYGMPVQLFHNVLRDNLQLMHKLHTLNKEYFAFVRQVRAYLTSVACMHVLFWHHEYGSGSGRDGHFCSCMSQISADAISSCAQRSFQLRRWSSQSLKMLTGPLRGHSFEGEQGLGAR